MRLTRRDGTTGGLASVMLVALAGAALLPGCTRIKSSSGYIVDEALVASVQPGVDNKASVERTLGQPTWASEFDRNSYYYVSRNTEQIAFLTPKPTEQSVIIISFDPRGTVTKVERDGLDKVVSIKMSKDKTPVLGKETGIIQDLFGNIGTFSGSGAPGDAQGTGRDGPK